MQRTIVVKDVGKVTNNSDFNSWIAKHIITINHVEAQRDQQLLIYAALKRINKITESMTDGDRYEWVATVLMVNASEGFYRDKIVSITPITHWQTKQPMFQVTTYNILTGGLPWSGLSDYERETTGIAWKVRRHLVVNALKGSQVVMLNEATDDQKNYLVGELENMKIGSAKIKRFPNRDGSVILYDRTKFELIKAFSDFITDDHPQVVVAARLMHRSGQEVVFVSLHLKSGYDNMEQRRIDEFTAAMNKVKTEWNDLYVNGLYRVPVVVAGDLNSDYNRHLSNLVKIYVPETQSLRNAAADVGMESIPTYNYHHQSTFDYILISQQLQVLQMKTEKPGALAPNKYQGSDHFPVTAKLMVGTVAVGAAAVGATSGGGGKSESNFHMELRF